MIASSNKGRAINRELRNCSTPTGILRFVLYGKKIMFGDKRALRLAAVERLVHCGW